MNRVILDQAALDKIKNLKEQAEICDESGRVVGFFQPKKTVQDSTDMVEEDPILNVAGCLSGKSLSAEDIERELYGEEWINS